MTSTEEDPRGELDLEEQEEEEDEQWADVESAINNFLSEKTELKASLATAVAPPPPAVTKPDEPSAAQPPNPRLAAPPPPEHPAASVTSPHRPPSRSASSSRLLTTSHSVAPAATRPLVNPLISAVLAAAPSLPHQLRGSAALRSTDSVDSSAVSHPQHSSSGAALTAAGSLGGGPPAGLNSADSVTNSPLHPALSHRPSTTRPLTQQGGRRSSHTGGVALMPSLEEQLQNGASSNSDLKRLWGGGGAASGGNYVALSVRKLQQDSGPGLPRYARATASSLGGLGGSGSLLMAAGGPGGGGGGSGPLAGAPGRRQSIQGEGFGGSGALGPRPSTVASGDGRQALRASTSCLRLPSAGSGGGAAVRGVRASVDGSGGGGGGGGGSLPHGVLSNDGALAGPPAGLRGMRGSVDGGGSRESSASGVVGAYSALRPHSNSGNGAASTSDSGAAGATRLKGSPTGPLAPDAIEHISEGSSEDEGDGPSRSDSSTGSLHFVPGSQSPGAAAAPAGKPSAPAATAAALQQPQLTPRRSSAVSSRFAMVQHLASTLSSGGGSGGGGSGRLVDSAPHSPAFASRPHGAAALVAHHQGRLSEAGAGGLPAAASPSPGGSPRGVAGGGAAGVTPVPPNIPKPRVSASGGQAGGVPAVPSPSRARMLQARSNSGLLHSTSGEGGAGAGAPPATEGL